MTADLHALRALLLTFAGWANRQQQRTIEYLVEENRVLGVMGHIQQLVVRMASENASWGYTRIQGALKDLGHRVGRSTISRILKSEGIKPAQERPWSWKTFLKAHWGEVAAADFFTAEVWTPKGLVTYYTLFLIDPKTRRVHIAGSTPNPGESFMVQVARSLTDVVDGFLLGPRVLLCDRDTQFADQFRRALKDFGVVTVLTPPRAPNCNAFAERFLRSIKEECLGRMILFGGRSLHRALREFGEHYHRERSHQGLDNRIIVSSARARPSSTTNIRVQERLGGILRHYRAPA